VTTLHRARFSLLAAVGLASALLVFELPVSELLHQRSQLASVSNQLAGVQARNDALARAIASLQHASTIGSMAHAQYGLVHAGQQAYALLPTGGAATGGVAAGLADQTVPSADLVVPSADSLGSSAIRRTSGTVDGAAVTGSVWSRALDRLSFWRWAF
jgi:cell division protein FtsB